MRKILFVPAAVLALATAVDAAAQRDVETVCDAFDAQVRSRCVAVAEAVNAGQPQLGMLMAGGNPILGTAGAGGVRLGFLPRVSAGARVNVVLARLPDIREAHVQGDEVVPEQFRVPAPAVGANVAVGLTRGASLAPMVGGFGAVDLLGSVTMMPLDLLGVTDLGGNPISWGAGARVGLLRETFVTPGISVSMMYRRMGEVRIGDVCPGHAEQPDPTNPDRRLCPGGGDFGEAAFGLDNWSGRATVGKRLLGFGVTGGLGWDRFTTDADLAFRAPAAPSQGVVGAEVIYRFDDVRVSNTRLSAFVNAGFTLLVGSVVAEVGVMQGGSPVPGFPAAADFDPRAGTVFGSLGARLSL
jgi:hypothetical protein